MRSKLRWMTALSAALLAGCSALRGPVNPMFRLGPSEIEQATMLGKAYAGQPSTAYVYGNIQANQLVNTAVYLETVRFCLPREELAYQIAKVANQGDAAVQRATDETLQVVTTYLKVVVHASVAKGKDPNSLQYQLKTDENLIYYPDVTPSVSQIAGQGGPYGGGDFYEITVLFPVLGHKNTPPIGPKAKSFVFTLLDGSDRAEVKFDLPIVQG